MDVLVVSIGVIFITYLVKIYIDYGLLDSVSASYYKLKDDRRGFIFQAFIWYLSFSLLAIGGIVTEQESIHGWTFFAAGAFGAFVGIAAAYKDEMPSAVHVFGAWSMIVFSLLGIGLVFGNWWPTYILIVSTLVIYICRGIVPKHIYWIEVVAFVCIFGGLLSWVL